MKTKSLFTLAFVVLMLVRSLKQAADDTLTTSVFSKQASGYKREKLQDGTFKPEYYAISNGGYSPGVGKDPSIDEVPFSAIAGVVAQHLAKQNYFLAKDSKSAQLLLVIQWGASVPFSDSTYKEGIDRLSGAANSVKATAVQKTQVEQAQTSAQSPDGIQSDGASAAQAAQNEFQDELVMMQMNNSARDKANERNANLLGYMGEMNSANDQRRVAGAGTYYNDLVSDIENKRYYVIVSAFDFRAATQEKSKKLLWSTRVSIQAQGNRFDERLVTMMANASRQFGQDSGRLIRQYQRAPRVDLGELKYLGVVSDPSKQVPPSGQK